MQVFGKKQPTNQQQRKQHPHPKKHHQKKPKTKPQLSDHHTVFYLKPGKN